MNPQDVNKAFLIIMDNKFRHISMRFLALTTPVYAGFFVILLLIRGLDYDQFSDQSLLVSIAHVFGLQILHWLLLLNKKHVSRSYMTNMLWFMVYNNVFMFSYWVSLLDSARSFIYILAPMSVISLFSISNMKQAVLYNFILSLSLGVSAAVSVTMLNQPFVMVGLDWIYITVYFVVSIWLSNLSGVYLKSREQLSDVIRREKASKTELEYTLKKLAKVNIQLEAASHTDALTQIYNRRYFNQAIERAWGGAIVAKQSLSLLMIDVDYFKKFNDDYGHQIGDECLRGVAHVIKQCLGREGDEVCRYGGEEFVVILPSTNTVAAISVAERIRLAIAEYKLVSSDKVLEVTVSVGISTLSNNNMIEQTDTLIMLADEALYRAKKEGRNCTFHANNMNT